MMNLKCFSGGASLVLFFAFINLAINITNLQAQSPRQLSAAEWEQVHQLTVAAMNEMYNLRFAEAEQKTGEVIKLAPQDPRGYFFRAMIYYYRNLLYKDKADYEKFIAISSKAIQVCEALLKDNPKDSKALFYMGGLQGYRGLLSFNNDDMTKAMWEGKKGMDNIKLAMEADPNNIDAQMGSGLFSFLVSQAPSFIRPALKLAGLTGDRVTGLKQLETVAAKGVYAKYEAMFWLSTFYRWNTEQQYERAGYHLGNLMTAFPENDFYQNLYGSLLLNNLRKADKAIAQYQSIVNKGAKVNRTAMSLALLNLGIAHMYKNKFDEAKQWYQKCISLGADESHMKSAKALTGVCLELQGNRAAAVQYYQQAPENNTAKSRLKEAYTPHEITLVKQSYLFNAGDFDASAALGEQLQGSAGVSDEVKAQSLYTLGRVAFEQGNYAKAEERFLQAMNTPSGDETWLPPMVRYRLGLAQMKLGKKNEAKASFDAAMSFSKYDGEENTKRLIQKELARLKNS
jgi:tetratricopeptide (TPR) repeat protein